ncbi:hypothetical protein PMY56_10165 [Clostridium tertium]|nr:MULTISPECIES: hypothetical protein [Clostridium]MDB1922102.1 hypothetical protein [Clostridium tertium]MDB1926505.1 hypothetical protein [Clostridium tertium]MDB1929686.1 hypothetical protein [Clostridium tertium]MDU3548767.1 hypothetical protein [Clostridium sp.]MDU4737271.1 hypothetical protein [Clostridium sp.]
MSNKKDRGIIRITNISSPYKIYDINEDIGVCNDCIEREFEKD